MNEFTPNAIMRSALSSILGAATPVANDLSLTADYYRGGIEAPYEISESINSPRLLLKNAIFEAWQDASLEGWDGYGAAPVSYNAYDAASRFAESLPFGVAIPEVSPEADGGIEFDWRTNDENQLSVSVNSSGIVSYAGYVNGNGVQGQYNLNSVYRLPEEIVQGVEKVAA